MACVRESTWYGQTSILAVPLLRKYRQRGISSRTCFVHHCGYAKGCRHWSHNVRSGGGQLGNDFCQVFLHTDITCLDWSVLSMVWGTSMRSSISSNDWG